MGQQSQSIRFSDGQGQIGIENQSPLGQANETVEPNSEAEWMEVIDRRSREMEQGTVSCRPVDQAVSDIRKRLHARHQALGSAVIKRLKG